MSNLAGVLHSQGKFTEAEPIFREVLTLRIKELGQEHPDTITSINNLASVLDKQGKDSKAEKLYRQALQLCRNIFPDQRHPNTLISIHNLALFLLERDDKNWEKEAKALCWECIAGYSHAFGPNHSKTIESFETFVVTLLEKNKSDEVDELKSKFPEVAQAFRKFLRLHKLH